MTKLKASTQDGVYAVKMVVERIVIGVQYSETWFDKPNEGWVRITE